MEKNYYEVLGVKKDATTEEISAAYKKMAMKYHPDRQHGKTDEEKKAAEEKFKECAEAAEVLKDPEKRRNYDQFGSADMRGGFGGAGVDPFEFFRKMAGFGFGSGDDFGGFGFNMGNSRSRKEPDFDSPEDGASIQAHVNISFKESIRGCSRDLVLDIEKECPECHGTGAVTGSKPEKCGHCGGRGQIVKTHRMGMMMSQQIMQCPDCGGTGYSVKKCGHCHGEKRVIDKRDASISVKIPAGVQDGRNLRLRGIGQCGVKGGSNGDVFVHVQVEDSDIFVRSGNDVFVRVFVSAALATLGGKIDVPTPYGYRKMKLQAGTTSGTRLRISGAGVKPESGSAGDLIVEIQIEPYSNVTDEQRRLLEAVLASESDNSLKQVAALKKNADEFYS